MEGPPKERLSRSGRDSVSMGLIAMVFFIIWGLLVNWEYGVAARIQVAVTQGVVSMVSTALSAEFIRWVVMRWKSGGGRRIFGAGFVRYVFIYTLVALAHAVAGTPEILRTMMPGLIVGVFFCFGYSWRISSQLPLDAGA
ncbi:hypothetical protein ACFSSA_13035 [Luteolibacter algae]|uniref:ATP synthase subunit I n=1 Tax=Luteolibacter algae TaxID=454151 RepID=A0ABW5DD67_9BACT